MTAGPVRVALLAIAIAIGGLLLFVALFNGPDTYGDIARSSGRTGAAFRTAPDLTWSTDLIGLTDLHARTLAYVLGRSAELPSFATTGRPLFEANERSHMADVRGVFRLTGYAFVVALVVIAGLVRWTSRRERSRLVRDASVVAGATVALIAVVAAVAFDPLFLLFHETFFPQGNFLFPADSNLLTLYPDEYWYGVTLRIGVAFVVAMAVTSIGLSATLRQARR
ncbi:MAG TPA: DUF1461 domain-containing protein [Candidatus Limnocylindria bacterium]|nr:DUF1461 domain-containing protein [Candidatus Limnocylindria bacterium]